MKKISPERLRPIREEVYLQLRSDILLGRYMPGEKLFEEQLSSELGVSRTPVREALRMLEMEKMLVHYPHRSTEVAELPLDEADELREVWSHIAEVIARRAARVAAPADIRRLKLIADQIRAASKVDEIVESSNRLYAAVSEMSGCVTLADAGRAIRETLVRMAACGYTQYDVRAAALNTYYLVAKSVGLRAG